MIGVRNGAAWSLLLVLTGAFVVTAHDGRPQALRDSAGPELFSAERAAIHIARFAKQPRPVGSAAHKAAAGYIESVARELKLAFSEQVAFSAVTKFGTITSAANVRNLIVVVPRTTAAPPGVAPPRAFAAKEAGTGNATFANATDRTAKANGTRGGPAAPGAILLMAHYDSAPTSPGASDDGYGTAALLEMMRWASQQRTRHHDWIFLFTDAEERGLLGARAFAKEHPLMEQIRFVINAEARGNQGPSLLFESGAGSESFLAELLRSNHQIQSSSVAAAVYNWMPNDTDFSIFRDRGLPGVNFANLGGVLAYHSMHDTVAAVDQRTLQHLGDSLLASLQKADTKRWPHVNNPRDPENSAPANSALYAEGAEGGVGAVSARWQVHFGVPLLGNVVLPGGLALFLALLSVAGGLFAGVATVDGVPRRQTRSAVALLLVAIPGTALTGYLLQLSFSVWHSDTIVLQGGGHFSALLSWAFALLSLLIMMAWTRRWRDPLHPTAWLRATALLWSSLGLVCVLFVPGATYLFSLPLLPLIIALVALHGAKQKDRTAAIAYACVLAVLVLAVAPVARQLLEATTSRTAFVVSGLLGLWLAALAPLFVAMRPRAFRAVRTVLLLLLLALLGSSWWLERGLPQPAAVQHISQPQAKVAAWLSCFPPRGDRAAAVMGSAKRSSVEDILLFIRRCPYTRERFYRADAPLGQLSAPVVEFARGAEEVFIQIGLKEPADLIVLAGIGRSTNPQGSPGSEPTSQDFVPASSQGAAYELFFSRIAGQALAKPQRPGVGQRLAQRMLGLGAGVVLLVGAPGTRLEFSIPALAAPVELYVLAQRPLPTGLVPGHGVGSLPAPVAPFHDSALTLSKVRLPPARVPRAND